ncbi:hypothetical protein ABIA33_007433 [Streptacidiphilus sp. MAP12-16]
MDHASARQLAVAKFTASVRGRIDDWDVTGPMEGVVRTLSGPKPLLIFRFRPREGANTGWDRARPPLSVAVDPDSGGAEMLR